ncbi:MAG: hypothetical protein KJ077_00920 [Anaerolineae bacterium]|nr:hypothetical protein [Anaerolineae bacterium]
MEGLAGDFGPRRGFTPWKVAGNRLKSGGKPPRCCREDGQKKAEPRGEVATVGIEAGTIADHPLEGGEKESGNQGVPPEKWLKDP